MALIFWKKLQLLFLIMVDTDKFISAYVMKYFVENQAKIFVINPDLCPDVPLTDLSDAPKRSRENFQLRRWAQLEKYLIHRPSVGPSSYHLSVYQRNDYATWR